MLGIVSLVWFAGGANDYIMTKTANQAYLGMAADSMGVSVDLILDYFNGYPMWATVCWALGVWGAFAGSVLLLLRSRFAVPAMLVALLGLIGTTVYNYGMADVPASMEAPVLDVAIWAVTLFLLVYARTLRAAGVLR